MTPLLHQFKSAVEQWAWPTWLRQKSILVCEADIESLRVAVLRYDGSVLLEQVVQSNAATLDEAIDEVVAGLRARGWRGSQAVVLSHAALYSMMELPVHPKTRVSDIEMQDLLAWDFEPLMSQHASSWTEQSLLMALGKLTEEQLQEAQELRRKDGLVGYGGAAKQLTDVLLKTEAIKQSHIDRCRLHLDWLKAEAEEDFYCAWAAQVTDASTEDGGGFPWLVAGMPVGLVQRWQAGFARHNIEVKGLYPLAGAAASLLKVDAEALLLEIHAGLVCGVRMSAGGIREIRQRQAGPDSLLSACQEIYHEIGVGSTDVFLAGSHAFAFSVTELMASLACTVQSLDIEVERVSPYMLGVAQQVFKLPGLARLCAVPVQAYLPAWWRRAEIRLAIGAWLLLLLMGAVEISLQFRHGLAESELMQLNQKKQELLASQAKVQKRVDEIDKLYKERKVQQDALDTMKLRQEFFGGDLPDRTAFIQEFLMVLERATTEDVMLNNITESAQDFSISGWALSETSALQFIQAVKGSMKSWGLELKETNVESKMGVIGITGYDFRFKLVPAVPSTLDAKATEQDKGVKL